MQRLLSVKLATNLPKTLSSSSLFHFQPHKTFSLTKPPQNLFFSSFPTHPLQHQHNLTQKVHGFFSNPLLRKHFSLDSANTLLRVSSKRLSDCRLAFLQRKIPKQNFQFFPSSDAHLSARRSWYGRVSSNDVLLGLIIANFAVFLLWKIADPVFMVKNFTWLLISDLKLMEDSRKQNVDGQTLYIALSLYIITSGRLHTLITSAFSHLVVEDILLNMFLLSVFGKDVGRTFGPEFLLKLYLAGAIGGSVFYLVQYVLLASKDGDLSNSPILTLGAQGAVTAVMYFDLLQLCTRIPAFLYYLNILLMAYRIGDSISRILQGNSSSGNAHVGGAAVATIAWVRLRTGLVRESERRLEKLSLRKQLKLKCQEQNLTPVHDRALVPVGTGAEIFQPTTVPFYGQPGEQIIPLNQSASARRSFQAKVTERLFDGYTIETVIDGKPLRGVLFSNKSEFSIPAAPNSSRKRAASEAVGIMSNGGCNSKSKDSKGISQEAIDLSESVNAHAKESASHEIARGQVTDNPVQLVNPLNQGDTSTSNTLQSNTEGLGNDRTKITTGGHSAAIS